MLWEDAKRCFSAVLGEIDGAGDAQKKTAWQTLSWSRRKTWLRWLKELRGYMDDQHTMALARIVAEEKAEVDRASFEEERARLEGEFERCKARYDKRVEAHSKAEAQLAGVREALETLKAHAEGSLRTTGQRVGVPMFVPSVAKRVLEIVNPALASAVPSSAPQPGRPAYAVCRCGHWETDHAVSGQCRVCENPDHRYELYEFLYALRSTPESAAYRLKRLAESAPQPEAGARGAESTAFVEWFRAIDDPFEDFTNNGERCRFCFSERREPHADACIWMRARVAAPPVSTETREEQGKA